jgi:hypothetical protein
MDDTERFGTDAESGQRRGMDGVIVDLARKAVATSVKSLLSSEEGLRALIGAMVPKEIGQYVSRELAAFRSGFLEAMTGEISRFLDRIDPAAEIQKVVDGMEFDIHVKVGVSRRKSSADEALPAKPVAARKAARKPAPKRPRKKA